MKIDHAQSFQHVLRCEAHVQLRNTLHCSQCPTKPRNLRLQFLPLVRRRVTLIAVGIFGGIFLLRYEQSRLAYVPKLSGSGHNGPSASSAPELPVVSLAKDGTLYLNKDMVKVGDLSTVIRQQFGSKVKAVYVRADKDTTFQPITEVLDVLGAGGFRVKMVTQPRGL